MPWTYTATTFHGNKTTPAKGNYVTVQVSNPDLPEGERHRYLTFTFDGKKTRAQFVTMVKAEVKATLQDWNTTLPEVDATDDFQITALAIAAMEAEPEPETPAPPPPTRTKTVRASAAKAKD